MPCCYFVPMCGAGEGRYSAVITRTNDKGRFVIMSKYFIGIVIHAVVYLLAQFFFASVSQSWPWEVISGNVEVTTLFTWNAPGTDFQRWMGAISRIWTFVFIVDTAFKIFRMANPKERQAQQENSDSSSSFRG